MSRRRISLLLFLASAGFAFAREPTPSFADLQDGQAIAAHLRSLVPEESSEWSGALKIRRPDQAMQSIPVTSRVVPGEKCWRAIYTAGGARKHPLETLTVIRSTGPPNQYLYRIGAEDSDAQAVKLTGAEANRPFAGSDFWLSDLGMDFLYWPNQTRLKGELRRGQSCHVLESRPAPGVNSGYSRVVSWIDKDTGGVIEAEAYDQQGARLKEFSVGSFKKVNGIWHLKEMEMRNRQTGSRTKLEFDIQAAEK